MDFIVQLLGNGKIMEFGGSEVGRFFKGEHGRISAKTTKIIEVKLNKQVIDVLEKIEIGNFVKGDM